MIFGLLKLQHLLSKHNPSVNSFIKRDALDETDVWQYDEQDEFMMAFAVTQFPEVDIVKNDEFYVKWHADRIIQEDGVSTFSEIPMHKCTPEEMDRFYEPTKASSGLV